MTDLPASVQQLFVDAGWHPGRFVDVPASVPADHPARDVLASFAGLVIPEREPEEGWPVVKEFEFEALAPDRSITLVWDKLLKSDLVGIARVHSDHAELYIDTTGRCFGHSLIHDAFYFHGASFGEAVEGILTGQRSRPMLRPGQGSVCLYGEWFTADSPELYRYF